MAESAYAVGFKIDGPQGHVGSNPTPGIYRCRPRPSARRADRVAPRCRPRLRRRRQTFHGGRLIARRLKAHGVSKLFTLSGGHLFSIYDGCREEGIDIVDVRHESTAAFAAEGWAKVTREPGVCALTAGPGVTNGMSAMASAQANHSPMVVLGGRAPALRWGQGSLQEIDHVPFVRPLTKLAAHGRQHRGDPGPRRRRLRGGAARPTAAPRSSTSRSTTSSWRRPSPPARRGAAAACAERGRGAARRSSARASCCAAPSAR